MDKILKYFPGLTERQREQFAELGLLYPEWNDKINVISRRDIDSLYLHHILHSLAIAKFITPTPGTEMLDMGTGGGFPGIPLAILWPEVSLHLIDRIGKKIKVAQDIAARIGLQNVTFQHGDVGECRRKFDFVVSRAVMALPELVAAVRHNISPKGRNAFPNGLLCLKGGDLEQELRGVSRPTIAVPLSDWFNEPYFDSKQLIYVEM